MINVSPIATKTQGDIILHEDSKQLYWRTHSEDDFPAKLEDVSGQLSDIEIAAFNTSMWSDNTGWWTQEAGGAGFASSGSPVKSEDAIAVNEIGDLSTLTGSMIVSCGLLIPTAAAGSIFAVISYGNRGTFVTGGTEGGWGIEINAVNKAQFFHRYTGQGSSSNTPGAGVGLSLDIKQTCSAFIDGTVPGQLTISGYQNGILVGDLVVNTRAGEHEEEGMQFATWYNGNYTGRAPNATIQLREARVIRTVTDVSDDATEIMKSLHDYPGDLPYGLIGK